MAKSLAQIQKQIDRLQREAETLKAKQVPGVIDRIRVAIAHYGLTVEHLFGAAASKGAPSKKASVRKRPYSKGTAAKKVRSQAKYRDEAGNSWTGHGKRPNWFKAAIASGRTPEDLAVKK